MNDANRDGQPGLYKGRHYTSYVTEVRALKRAGRLAEAEAPALFAYITGWRKEEILSLQWSQIDFEGKCACLGPGTTKNDEARVFPFTRSSRRSWRLKGPRPTF